MKAICKLLFLTALILFSINVNGQIDVKGKVKDQANDRANNHVDNAINDGFDAVENGIKGAFKGKKNKDKQEAKEDNSEEANDQESDEDVKPDKEKSGKATESFKSYSKYDFVPGDKVLFYEDFSQDAVGDFPAQWTTNGSGEVKTMNIAPGNWLHLNTEDAVYCYINKINFPENFIFEFDAYTSPIAEDEYFGNTIAFFNADDDYTIDDLYPGTNGVHITYAANEWNVMAYSGDKPDKRGESSLAPVSSNQMNHIIIWVQKQRIRIYNKGQKVVDLPTGLYPPSNYNRIRFSCWSHKGAPYISNLRLTTAGADTRSKLLTEGKLISYGIYFDVNKDVVKPESYGALNDIAKVLKENPDVRIRIVGYTDSDGSDAANLDLSKRRGAAVKNELTKSFGIDASRMESDGKGEANPIAPNDSPSNKSLNRRVEFIKL